LQHGLQSGDFYFATYFCTSNIQHRLAMGHDLDDVYRDSSAHMEFVRKTGILDPLDIQRTTIYKTR
jgi:hypothetical protein